MKYLLALFPTIALAGTPSEPPTTPPEAPKQAQEQSQSQRQSQYQSAFSEANSASEASSNLSVEDRRQAPSVFAPAIAPTAPCYYSHSGGLSVPGFGASGGKALKDEACELRENIRLAYAMGLTREADYLFCSTIGKDIPNCGVKVEPPKTQCDEKVERVFEKCLAK